MILYRLTQDWNNLYEGSCISEAKFKQVFYLDKPMYEPLTEEDLKSMVEANNKEYIVSNDLEKLLFWNWGEVSTFNLKLASGVSNFPICN